MQGYYGLSLILPCKFHYWFSAQCIANLLGNQYQLSISRQLSSEMDLWERSSSLFWSEWFWFPPNVTWKDLENKPGTGIYYPQTSDLLVSIAVAALLYLIRQLYEK